MTSSLDRMLSILDLFTESDPDWTVERAMDRTGFSRSTIYRYFKSLNDAGLMAPSSAGRYVLGPAVIEFDRLIRRHDPLLAAAGPVTVELARALGVAVVTEPFRERVVVTRVEGGESVGELSRGVAAELLDSAPGRVLLAHMAPRRVRRYYAANARDIADSDLGDSWAAFRRSLRSWRRVGFVVFRGRGPLGRIDVAAPVVNAEGVVVAALGAERQGVDGGRAGELVLRLARRIGAALSDAAAQAQRAGRGSGRIAPPAGSVGTGTAEITALRGSTP